MNGINPAAARQHVRTLWPGLVVSVTVAAAATFCRSTTTHR